MDHPWLARWWKKFKDDPDFCPLTSLEWEVEPPYLIGNIVGLGEGYLCPEGDGIDFNAWANKLPGDVPHNLMDKLRQTFDLNTPDGAQKAQDFISDTNASGNEGLLEHFIDHSEHVDAWESALTRDVDELIRTNTDFITMLAKFPYGTGKSRLINEATDGDWIQIFSGKLVDVPNPDPNGTLMVDRFGGRTGVKFDTDPAGKKFDLVNEDLIGEHKHLSTTTTINSGDRHSYRMQMIAAQKHNKDAIWVFAGVRNDSHINKVIQYAREYQVNTVIELNGMVIHNLEF